MRKFDHRQHRKSLPHDYKSMVATLPPIPGQIPSAKGERRKVGKTIDERSYPDEDSEEAGMEFNTVVTNIGLQIMLSRTKAGPGRAVKQGQPTTHHVLCA